MAEQLSAAGVPVFVADVKGDVSGLAAPGEAGAAGREAHGRPRRCRSRRPAFPTSSSSSLGGIGPGVPVRATVSDFGPQLLAKILKANETQEQSLALVFHYADAKGLPLLDLADLRALLTFLDSDAGKAELEGIGGLAKATVGVLLRALVGPRGRRRQRVLRRAAARRSPTCCARRRTAAASSPCLELPAVQDKPTLFSTALMWLLAELFETLPEAGRPGQAQARLLLRRGAPALRRRDRRVPRLGRADRAADPLQGRRRLLRHPDARRTCPADGARPARQPRPARAARVHAGRRQGAEGDRLDVPEVRLLRPRGAADADGHRRGGRDRSWPRTACPTPVVHTRLRAPASRMAPADDVDGAAKALAAVRQVRHARRQPSSAREMLAARAGGAGGRGGHDAASTPEPKPSRRQAPAAARRRRRLPNSRQGKALQRRSCAACSGCCGSTCDRSAPPFTDEHEELRADLRRSSQRAAPARPEWEDAHWFPNDVFLRAGRDGLSGPEVRGALRRPGRRLPRRRRVHRGARALRLGRAGRGHRRAHLDRHAADLEVRHRGPEAALSGARDPRREDRRARDHRARRRLRRRRASRPSPSGSTAAGSSTARRCSSPTACAPTSSSRRSRRRRRAATTACRS